MARPFLSHPITDDSALGGSTIERSLRFNAADNSRLVRTIGSTSNRRTYTYSWWLKRTMKSGEQYCWYVGSSSSTPYLDARFEANTHELQLQDYTPSRPIRLITRRRFEDGNSWYHFVFAVDTTQSVASNRVKLYVNGVQETSFSTETYPDQNYESSANVSGHIQVWGTIKASTSNDLDGYLAEINFIDGQQLEPTAFGYTDFQTGIWRPKRFIATGPNNGVTWSSTTEFNANAFNGNFGNNFLAQVSNGYYVATTSPFTIKQSLGVITGNGYHWGAKLNGSTEVTTGNLSGTMGVADRSIVNFDLSSVTLPLDVTNLQIKAGTGSSGSTNIYGIVIDGVILIDGDVSNIGLNGFHLEFKDNSSTSALGKDTSGNGNDFTTNNFAVSDSMPDTPTNNFAVMSPLTNYSGLSQGNLRFNNYNDSGGNRSTQATIALPKSGKWYWEARYSESTGKISTKYFGVSQAQMNTGYLTAPYVYYDRTTIANGNSSENISHGQDWYNGVGVPAILGCAVDVDNNSVKFYKDNSLQGTITLPTLTASQEYFFTWANTSGGSSSILNDTFNFGADSTFQGQVSSGGNTDANGIGDFKYAPPAGHLALCSNNLPSEAQYVISPKKHFDTLLYTGNGSTNGDNQFIPLEFDPDFVWIKSRSVSSTHNQVFDVIRSVGGDKALSPNQNIAEYGFSNFSFYDKGFDAPYSSSASYSCNTNSATYVAWCWKAGGAAVTNNDGSGTSQVSANQEAGFSVVTYSGNATGSSSSAVWQTIGHGLGKTPKWIIFKARNGSESHHGWAVYHHAVTDASTDYVKLNTTDARIQTDVNYMGSTLPTSSVFSLGYNYTTNESGKNYVAYCWTDIPGYSKFGVYKGNNNANGTYIHLGFRPAWVMIKNVDASSTEWYILDGARDPDNPVGQYLSSSSTASESTYVFYDFLSNGFKLRNTGNAQNPNNQNIIYMAFAEQSGSTAYATETNPR